MGVNRCSCSATTDCKNAKYPACVDAYTGARYKHCAIKCSADGDCKNTLYPKCNTTSGKCVACLTDTDCSGRAYDVKCNTTTGKCAECVTDTDCGTKSFGNKCNKGICNCATAADCTGRESGKLCDPNLFICSCLKEADCIGGMGCSGTTPFGGKVCK
jgi:hypothetical protein